MLQNIRAIYFRIHKQLFSWTFCMFQITVIALAQKGTGKLTGKVTDAATNESLAGVTISAKTTKFVTTSIPDGTYIFSLPPGTYTVRYSYTGHKTKEISGILIKAGESTFLDILLETATKELEGVVVSANIKKEAQSSVYSAQKRSAAVSDGISIEAIRRTPDNNAGQILKRVSGVNVQDNRFVVVRGLSDQYNQTMLNGAVMTSTETNRNAFAFDLIPAAVLDNITINKTATPDMPGNFGGGVVQINTKDFPSNDFFSVLLQTGYSDGTYRKNFYGDKRNEFEWLGFGGTTRDLPKGLPYGKSRNSILNLSVQEEYKYLKSLKNNLSPINYGPSSLNSASQLGFGKTIKFKNNTQFGIVAALNYRKSELIEQETVLRDPLINPPSPQILGVVYAYDATRYRYSAEFGGVLNLAYRFGNNKVTLKNFYTNVFNNVYSDRPNMTISSTAYTPGNVGGLGQLNPYRIVGVNYVVEQKGLINSTLAGEHRTGRNNETKLDWNVNFTRITTSNPDLRSYILTYDSVTKLYTTTANYPDITQSLLINSRTWSLTKDNIYGGVFNVTTPFNLLENKHLLKGGILFQNRERDNSGLVLPITDLAATSLDELMAPSQFYPGGKAGFPLAIVSFTAGSANYTSGSSLLAAYESLENTIKKKIRIIWGLRVESYQQMVNLFTPVYYPGFSEPELQSSKFASRATFNFLPSVNVVYSPVPSINFRGAYSNTVIRPELKDLADYYRYDLASYSLASGNSRLKSSSLTNYDLKFEWFPSSGEILSFSAFYKNITDPIEYARQDIGNDYSSKAAINSGKTYVKGLETEMRKKIDFIPFAPWLSHVTLFGNASLIASKVRGRQVNSNVISSFSEHRLTGQPNYILNGGITIQALNNTFEFTGSYNKTGDYINELGTPDLNVVLPNGKKIPRIPHYRVRSRDMVDLSISQSLYKGKFRMKLNVTNLLKKGYILYQDLNGNEKFDAPLKINPLKDQYSNYLSGVDNTPSTIVPQRTYSFSVSYTF